MSIINRPHSFSPSTTISSSEVNDNETTIYNEFNGSISAANLADGAVTTPKLASASVTADKLGSGSVTSAKVSGIDKSLTTTDSNPYKFSAYRNAAYNTTGGVIPFDTKLFDTNNDFDVTTNIGRYTAPVDGFYQFSSAVMASVGSGSHYIMALYKNGVEFKRLYEYTCSSTTNWTFTGSVLIELSAGDYIDVRFSPPGITTIFEGGAGAYTWVTGFLVSRT